MEAPKKSRKDVRSRLQQAAFALFMKKGYAAVTTSDIAATAGLTQRTFFRHFADKREVLFEGETALAAVLERAVREAPANLTPWAIIDTALRAATPLLIENRPLAEPRRHVIASEPALQEREAAKVQSLASAIARALELRGVPADVARLTAGLAIAVFAEAFSRWLAEQDAPFGDCLDVALAQAKDIIAPVRKTDSA